MFDNDNDSEDDNEEDVVENNILLQCKLKIALYFYFLINLYDL